MSQSLAGMDWDDNIREENQEMWKAQLSRLVDFPTLLIPRICIPADNESLSGIRLICVTDAAVNAGGAAVYAGRRLANSTWSCALVASKSKLMKATVPRNELSAIMLGTELVYLVAKSIGPKVEDILFATDSTIVLSWCCNPNKKLRLFVFSHVETIHRMIEWMTGNELLPIYHIDGELNLADLLTKKHKLMVRLFYQASELDEKVVYLDRQEACLDRKISTLRTEETRLKRTVRGAKLVIAQTTFDISLPKGKIIKIVDWVEAKTKQTKLLRSRAYELAVPGIYERMCGKQGTS